MKILVIFYIMMSFNLIAQTEMGTLSFTKADIEKSLDKLRQDGQISEVDYLKTKKELALMDQTKINAITQKGIEAVKKNPDQNNIDIEQLEKELNNSAK